MRGDEAIAPTPTRQRRSARADQPVVYSCSGCSSAAQTANALALKLDRLGEAEMSCIVGLGGDVAPLLRLAHSGRPIVALDGCPLVCVVATLRRHGLTPDAHLVLSEHGVRKRRHADPDDEDVNRLLPLAVETARSTRRAGGDPAASGATPAGPRPPAEPTPTAVAGPRPGG
ncbi:putative zinc-binding protein [Micromonospora coxensis]|uniref:putative zinc-binding protein n=1 Tax=Micromonospora coxensis TaxID=356852 RepID=UPI003427FA96